MRVCKYVARITGHKIAGANKADVKLCAGRKLGGTLENTWRSDGFSLLSWAANTIEKPPQVTGKLRAELGLGGRPGGLPHDEIAGGSRPKPWPHRGCGSV